MDLGLRSPMLDFFRRGEVAQDVRLLAAQGAVSPGALEQLALLVMLTEDPDAEVRRTAETTLSKLPVQPLSAFLARSEVPPELREFFLARGVPLAEVPAVGPVDDLVEHEAPDYGPEPTTEDAQQSMVQKLAAMTVPERVKAAMKGGREIRAILIRDANKLVALAVLSSPKMTETEIEAIARMGTVNEEVLRTIAQNRAWVKNYSIALSLVKNSKTPLTHSMNLLNRLVEKDVRQLLTNRNIPETLRIAARRKLTSPGG